MTDMAKTKKKGWINIYYHKDIDGGFHDVEGPWSTKEKARIYADADEDPADTIEIEWEEEV